MSLLDRCTVFPSLRLFPQKFYLFRFDDDDVVVESATFSLRGWTAVLDKGRTA